MMTTTTTAGAPAEPALAAEDAAAAKVLTRVATLREVVAEGVMPITVVVE